MLYSARILIVDDDDKVRKILRNIVEEAGYNVLEAANGSEAITQIENEELDLVLLDLGLPDQDGVALAYHIRRKQDVPIIIITGRDEVIDKVIGLESGAEDYITKPFHSRELVARLRTALRRSSKDSNLPSRAENSPTVAVFNEWRLNLLTTQLTSPCGADVFLTGYEYQILSYFVSNPNRVITRNQISGILNGKLHNPLGRNLDVLIGKTRKKLNDSAESPKLIKTLRNLGYIFISPVEFEGPLGMLSKPGEKLTAASFNK